MQTLTDWEEKVNMEKTERLILHPHGRSPYDVKQLGESEIIRHIGGWLAENGSNRTDTRKRCSKAKEMITRMAKIWSTKTKRGRGRESKLVVTARLDVMKAVVMPILTVSWAK